MSINHKNVQEHFVALRRAMVADGATRGVSFLEKDLTFLYESIEKEGTGFIYLTLPQLGRAVDQGLVTGTFTCPSNFRLKGKTKLPLFLNTVFKKVFGNDGVLLCNPHIESMRFLRQFLLFDGKVEKPPTKEQEVLAIQGFKQRQATLRKVKLDVSNPVLELAQCYLTRVLSKLSLDDIIPGHGPGAVAESYKRDTRWEWKSWPSQAERFYPFVPYGCPSPSLALGMCTGVRLEREPQTRCVLVPKDFRGPRLISAESASTQYLQQGQMKALMQYVDHHPILGRSIQFRDQSRNQERAYWACDGQSVTLDLSDASDTVSVPLVWYLFSGVPSIRRRLMATRSSCMRMPDGTLQKIVAFAPMGSAVCFPVETLVFWSLAIGSLALTRLTRPAYRGASLDKRVDGSLKELSSIVGVFGDDIVIPSDAYETLVATLLQVGCRPNMSKTCYATPFRESCGAEWFNKHDVTLIRNRKILYENIDKISNQTSMLELQRRFYVRGSYHTAEYFLGMGLRKGPIVERRVISNSDLFRVTACGRTFFQPHALDGHHEYLFHELRNRQHGAAQMPRCDTRQRECPFCRETYDDSYKGIRLCKLCEGNYPIDVLPCSFGYVDQCYTGLKTRWNKDLQRFEFLHRRHIQKCRPWAASDYARLIARVNGDYIERIPLRGFSQKRGWRNFH